MLWALIVALARLFGMADAGPATAWGLAAVAVSALVVVATAYWLGGREIADPSSPAAVDALTLRRRASRAAFLRLRDPAAAGRPRPRAPSTVAAA